MVLTVNIYEYINQKVMYIEELNYYFSIKPGSNVKIGRYKLDKADVCKIAQENDPEEYKIFSKSTIHDRIKKIKDFNKKQYLINNIKGEFTLCLHPSRICNLKCKYCFRESDYLRRANLNIETAKDAIDFFIDKYAPMAERYIIDLSGSGEPLAKIDLLKEIVSYCNKKRNEIFKGLGIMFASNFTMLTPEIVEYLDNELSLILGTSLDGDQITNDNNRTYANGKGTHDDIVKGLKMFKNKKFGVAVTITPLNQNVDEIYDYIYGLPNVDCISMRYVRSFDGGKYDFDNFDVSYLVSRYQKLCENIINNVRSDKPDYLTNLLKGSDFFGAMLSSNIIKGTNSWYRCDAGRNRIVINDEGNIYACSVAIDNKDFYIGNIYTSPVTYGQNESFWKVNKEQNDKCKSCSISKLCGGECYMNGYLKHHDMYKPLDKMCEIKTELNKLAIAFIEKLKHEYKDVFQVLLDFAFNSNDDHFVKAADWVTAKYLQILGFNIKYDMVHDNVNNIDFKNKTEVYRSILAYIKKYKPDVDLYQIDINDEIIFPAISILNNEEYLIILDEKEDEFVVTDLHYQNNEAYFYSKSDLIKNSNGIIIA